MDPISALLLSLALASLAVNTGSAAVGDAVAKVRGHTPPSERKWNARQDTRHRRGESAERDPGPWRRRWANSVEARTEKAAQKHQARMEALRDNADQAKAKHKERLHKRAQRREQVAATVAGWGHTSWDGAKHAAAKVREAQVERQAWRENTRRDTDTAKDTEQSELDSSNEGQEDAIPTASEDSTPDTTPDSEGNPITMNAPAHSGEITDLPTAIAYYQATVQYCDQITGTFETSQAQASAAVTDLGQQLATLETAQSTLAGQGVGGEIQTRMTGMEERFASLVGQLRQAEQLLSATQEEIASARADADAAGKALQAQVGIAEEIQSQQAGGVADNTAFYANA